MSRRSSQSRKARLSNLHACKFQLQPSSRPSSRHSSLAEAGSDMPSSSAFPSAATRLIKEPDCAQCQVEKLPPGGGDAGSSFSRVARKGHLQSVSPPRGRLVGGAPEDASGWEEASIEELPYSNRADYAAASGYPTAETDWGEDYDQSTWDAEQHKLIIDDRGEYKQVVSEDPPQEPTKLSAEAETDLGADYDESTWDAEYNELMIADTREYEQSIVEDPLGELSMPSPEEIMKTATALEAIREASKPLQDWDMSWPGEALENGLPATAGVAAARALKDPPLSKLPPGEPLSREFIVVIPAQAPADLGLRWRREVWPPEVDEIELKYFSRCEGIRGVRPGDQLVQVDGERTALTAPPRIWEMLVQRPATYLFRRSLLGHLEQVRQQLDVSHAPPQKHVGPAWHRNFPPPDSLLFHLERTRDRLDHGQAWNDDLDDDPDESEWAEGILRVQVKDGKTLGLVFSREHHPPKVAKLLPLQMDWWHAHGVSEGATLVKINGKSVRRCKPSDLAQMLIVRPLFLLFKPPPPFTDLDTMWAPSEDTSLLRRNAEIQMQNLEAVAVQARGAAELAEEARQKEAERVKHSEQLVLEAEAAAKKQHLEFEAELTRRAEAAAELADRFRIEETDRLLRMELEKQQKAEALMHRMNKLADVAQAANIEDQRRVRLEERAHVAEMKAENAVYRAEEAALAFRAEEAEQEAEEIVMKQHAELRLAWAEEQAHEDFQKKIQLMQKELALLDEVRGDLGPMRPKHEILELTVTIFSALGMRDEDLVGRSDPFCECEIVGRPETRFQTRVVENTVNPIWNCEREIKGYKKNDSLVFTVYDKDTRGSVRIGSAVLSNPEFHPDGFDGELVLADAARRAVAVLRVRVQIPQFLMARREKVKVCVFGAEGLRSEDPAGRFDSFCVCKLLGKSAHSFKTMVVPQTNQPVWNHEEKEMSGYCTGDAFEFLIYHQAADGQILLGKTSLACEQFLWDGFTGPLPLLQVGEGNPATLRIKVELHELPKDLSGVSKFPVDHGGIGINVTGDEPVGLVFEGSPPVIVSIQPGLEDDWAALGVHVGSTLFKINGVKTESLREDEIIELMKKRPLSLEFDDVGDEGPSRGKGRTYGKFGADRARRGRRKKRPPVKTKTELPGDRIKLEMNSQVAMGLMFGGGHPPEVEGINPSLKEYWEQQGVRLGMALMEVKDVDVQDRIMADVAPLLNLRPLSIVLSPPVLRKDLVRVTIVGANGLRDADADGKSDPFCVVQVPGKPESRFQTNIVMNERNPVWNYSHELKEFSVRDEDSLHFSIYDYDSNAPDFLGQTSLDLPQFLTKGFSGKLKLQPPKPRPGDVPTLTVDIEAPLRLGSDGKPINAEAGLSARTSVKPATKTSQRSQAPKVHVPVADVSDLPGDRLQVKLTGDTLQTGFRMGSSAPPSIVDFMPQLKDFWESLGLQIGSVLLEVNEESVETRTGTQVAPLLRKRPLSLVFQRPLTASDS